MFVREQSSSALWYSRPGKHPLSTHLLSVHFRSRPGKAPTFRAPLSRPKSTPPSATGFREPPYEPAWLRETPYTTIGVFPVVSGGFASTIRTLTNTVCGLPKQGHKSLYIQLISTALHSRAVDQSHSFSNNTIVTSDHLQLTYIEFRVFAGRLT